jgi:hypothetical protein
VTATLLAVTLATPSSATTGTTTPFYDGFENGNTWTPYTNGANGVQSIVTDPVHSGSHALQISADTGVTASDIGLAEIKDTTFTEDKSQLTFWYYASGGATFANLTVEAYTTTGAEYFQLLPGAVATGAWTEASVMFSAISPSLRGADLGRFVIKAVAAPNTGTATFTIDDVTITDGVTPPANLVVTSPTDMATDVATDAIATAYFDADLDPASISSTTVTLTDENGLPVAAALRYQVGQKAVAIVPDAALASDATYHVSMHGLATATGGGVSTDPTWTFTTGHDSAAPETVLSDDLDTIAGWSAYSNAPVNGYAIVGTPAVSGTALQVTASGATDPFVASLIRQTNWLDENSTLGMRYQITGTSTPHDLVVALTTAAGFTKWIALPLTAPDGDGWRTLAVRVADVDPGLVGQVIRTVELKVETSTGGTIAYTLDDLRITDDLSTYATPPAPASRKSNPLGAQTRQQIEQLATQVKSAQQPDGSLVVGPLTATFNDKVDPYAANYAVLGLLRAYDVTHNRDDLTAANEWLSWYQRHMDTNGVVDDCRGFYPNCVDTGSQDSVDSYASTYLMASLAAYTTGPSPAQDGRYLQATYPYVRLADKALDLVYQQDGTTIAKPSYPVRYTMDNAETYNGLVASYHWALAAGDSTQAKLDRYLAARTLYALRNRFFAPSVGYAANAVDPNGSLELSLRSWYPDALSSILLLAQIGQPTATDKALFDRLVTQFDTNDQADRPTALTDTPQYMWWAQAALQVGEPEQAAHFVAEYRSIEGAMNPATFAITAGHLIRVLSYPYDGHLWF